MTHEVSQRLSRWVVRVFPEGSAEPVLDALRHLPAAAYGNQDAERIHAALVLRTQGDWSRFRQMLTLVQQDWRDALVTADLADEDWPERLTANLD